MHFQDVSTHIVTEHRGKAWIRANDKTEIELIKLRQCVEHIEIKVLARIALENLTSFKHIILCHWSKTPEQVMIELWYSIYPWESINNVFDGSHSHHCIDANGQFFLPNRVLFIGAMCEKEPVTVPKSLKLDDIRFQSLYRCKNCQNLNDGQWIFGQPPVSWWCMRRGAPHCHLKEGSQQGHLGN